MEIVATDPTEKFKQWTSAVFLAALAALDIPVIIWEFVVRKGNDPGIISAAFVIVTVVLAGPVGIRIVRNGNGNGGGDSAPRSTEVTMVDRERDRESRERERGRDPND